VLLIDALDELVADDPQRAYDPRIEFLPPIVPPGVRVVLTCRPNIPLVQALEGWLVNLTRREVPPLSAGDSRRLLESRLDKATLRAVESMLRVDELFARLGGNPLLLSKASERIEELARQASAVGRPLRLTLADLPATLQAVFRDEYNRIGERAGTRPGCCSCSAWRGRAWITASWPGCWRRRGRRCRRRTAGTAWRR
jgi:hypothetical protein